MNLLGKSLFQNSNKESHSNIDNEKSDFITIYFEESDMRIEFAFTDVKKLSILLNTIVNGENREAIINVIDKKLRNAGLVQELTELSLLINTSIRPSEVYQNV
jgi:hypothetical protein